MAFSSITTLTGCKKDCEEPELIPDKIPIEGIWVGTYTSDGRPDLGNLYSCYIIKPDGTIINETMGDGVQHFNVGTWNLTGNSFSATTTCVYGYHTNIGIVLSHSGTFSETEGTLTNGIWRMVPPKSQTGTFTVSKVE